MSEKDADPNKIKEAGENSVTAAEQIRNLVKALGEAEKSVEGMNSEFGNTVSAFKSATKTGEDMGDLLSRITGTSSGLNKSIRNVVDNIQDADKMFMGFAHSIKQNFSAMSVGISIAEKMSKATMDLVGATDDALTSFQRSTGALSTYGSKITALEESTYMYGVTIEEAADSTASLVTGIRNFNTFSDASQGSLMKTTAILNEMGVEAGITSQGFNFMINSLGMTTEQADRTTREMFTLAKAMGMPPQEMAESFNSAAPQLAAFGNNATQVFQKMAVNARNVNMEVADMLRITEQFDKFESAAGAVGKLNAALGGPYLSTMKMVTTTDPTERLKMISGAAREAGKSFDDMEYYERKMMASAMNLKDVNELALVMKGRFDLVGPAVKETSASIEELAEQTQAYNTIADELDQIKRAFAINLGGPVASAIKAFSNAMGVLLSSTIPAIIAGIGLIGAAALGLAATIVIATATATFGLSEIMRVIAIFVVTAATGLMLIIKSIVDVAKRSQPFMEKFNSVWESIAKAFEKFKEAGKGVKPAIDEIATSFGNAFAVLIEVNQAMSDKGAYRAFGKMLGFVAQAVVHVVFVVAKLFEILSDLAYMLTVGHSPSMVERFQMLASAITLVGNAFKYPIQMIGKMMSGLSKLANMLSGKALGFISGAVSYAFGGVAQGQVSNGGFDRKEDMDSKSVSIGEEVAKAVKEALQGVQLNNKIELEVTSPNGLPKLFDYVQKNLDDVSAGRTPNYALNASRAGIQ